MAESVVSLILEGEDSGASAALDAVGGQLGGLGGTLGSLAPGGVLAAGAVAGIVAVGASVIGVTAAAVALDQEFDAAMNNFQARTGAGADEMEDFRDIATDIFTNNWGDSLGDVADAMAVVNQITGEGGDGLEELTQSALIMRDVFDKDVTESADTAKVLMDEFGLSGTQAMDFMVAGIQEGLDRNGDFLDSIREYGGLFGEAGFEADEFFSIMETGAQGGVLGTDKISDAVKEMQVRLNEGGEEVSGAFEQMGLDFDQIAASVAAGDETWADYFPNIIAGLNDIEDPITRSQAQTAIFGTMAEDLGVSFTESLDMTSTSLADMEGRLAGAGDVVSQGLGPAWEGFKRTIQTSLLPLGDWVGGALEAATPHLEKLGEWLGETIPVATAVLRDYWVEVAWPAIIEAGVWIQENIVPHLITLGEWLGEKVPEALETMRAFWVDEAWPVIQDTLESIWGFIEPNILIPLGEWLEEKIPVALDTLKVFWVDEAWPAIQEGVELAWDVIVVILEGIQLFFDEILPTAIENGKTIWEQGWEAMRLAVAAAKDFIQPVFDAFKEFFDFLETHVFSFKINLPDLPDWATPGSPLPLHSAWEDFGDYLNQETFRPDFDLSDAEFPGAAGVGGNSRLERLSGGVLPASSAPAPAPPQIIYQFGDVQINDQATGRLFMQFLEGIESQNLLGAFT